MKSIISLLYCKYSMAHYRAGLEERNVTWELTSAISSISLFTQFCCPKGVFVFWMPTVLYGVWKHFTECESCSFKSISDTFCSVVLIQIGNNNILFKLLVQHLLSKSVLFLMYDVIRIGLMVNTFLNFPKISQIPSRGQQMACFSPSVL